MSEYLERKITKALGISVGDIVSTSYKTGPYEVFQISGPRWIQQGALNFIILPEPVISLACIVPGTARPRIHVDKIDGWLNDIRFSEGKWLTAQNDEIFVSKSDKVANSLLDLIELRGEEKPTPERPRLLHDLDWSLPVRNCEKCNLYWNFETTIRGRIDRCSCGNFAHAVVQMPDNWGISAYMLGLNAP